MRGNLTSGNLATQRKGAKHRARTKERKDAQRVRVRKFSLLSGSRKCVSFREFIPLDKFGNVFISHFIYLLTIMLIIVV